MIRRIIGIEIILIVINRNNKWKELQRNPNLIKNFFLPIVLALVPYNRVYD